MEKIQAIINALANSGPQQQEQILQRFPTLTPEVKQQLRTRANNLKQQMIQQQSYGNQMAGGMKYPVGMCMHGIIIRRTLAFIHVSLLYTL